MFPLLLSLIFSPLSSFPQSSRSHRAGYPAVFATESKGSKVSEFFDRHPLVEGPSVGVRLPEHLERPAHFGLPPAAPSCLAASPCCCRRDPLRVPANPRQPRSVLAARRPAARPQTPRSAARAQHPPQSFLPFLTPLT